MQDMVEQIPSEEDERIYALWQSGKTLRVCAREVGISTLEAEYAIDRCLPPFSSASQLRAYKRDLQRLDDVGAYYYTKAMSGCCDSAHIFARVQERRSAISGWSSVNIRMDPLTAEADRAPSSFQNVYDMIMRISKKRDDQLGVDGAGADPAVGALSGFSDDEPSH